MGKRLALWVVPAWVPRMLHWSQVLLGPSYSSPLSLLSSESPRVTVSFFSGLWQSASSIRPCACSLHSSVISIISIENPIKSSISVVLWSLFFINHASLSFVPLSGPMLVFEGPSGGLPRGGYNYCFRSREGGIMKTLSDFTFVLNSHEPLLLFASPFTLFLTMNYIL